MEDTPKKSDIKLNIDLSKYKKRSQPEEPIQIQES